MHRALIRAKVALVRGGQPGVADSGNAEVLRLLAVAERCAWRGRGASALVVCGVPASGKSTVARALGTLAGCTVITSDIVRKELAGMPLVGRGPDALYAPEVSRDVYRELGCRAAAAMASGTGVIVDATFRRRADRDAFTAGWDDAAPFTFVQCVAPADVVHRRALAREADPDRISDADAEVVDRERDRFEPLDEAPAAAHFVLRTDRSVDAILADTVALLDVRLGDVALAG